MGAELGRTEEGGSIGQWDQYLKGGFRKDHTRGLPNVRGCRDWGTVARGKISPISNNFLKYRKWL